MKMLDMHEIRLTYEADLPARSGLGTSSSFAVGMLNAFYALKGKYADKKRLADEQFTWNEIFARKLVAGRIRLLRLSVDSIVLILMKMGTKFFR